MVISWNPVSAPNLAGYIVYRNEPSTSLPQPLTKSFITNTVYIDTVFNNISDTNNLIYTYRIKTQDRDANLSTVFSSSITLDAPSPNIVRTYFFWSYVNSLGDTIGINDSVKIVVRYQNKTRRNMLLRWCIESKENVVKTKKDSSFSGIDTISYAWATAMQPKIFVSATDQGNTDWWDSTTLEVVEVVNDIPNPDAGIDTTVSINDPVKLTGRAEYWTGAITMWERDIGNTGTFVRTSTPDTIIRAPSFSTTNYQCVLRVTDDDGNIALDTMCVSVIQDMPVAITGKDTIVSVGDQIKLTGRAEDKYGEIAKWEWDIGNTGTFVRTSTPDTTISAPTAQSLTYQCVLRVTNNDGNTAKDTITICIYNGDVTDIDGNKYHTVKIGKQEWTVENLRVTRYSDSTPIAVDNSSELRWGPCFWFNDNKDTNTKYGAGYTWYVVDTKKLSPAGWHIPDTTEWNVLLTYLIENGYNYDGTTTENKVAKSLAAKTTWEISTTIGAIGCDLSSNNKSGFTAYQQKEQYGGAQLNGPGEPHGMPA
jgi:uncharacterized protein (TIGR02145 family)